MQLAIKNHPTKLEEPVMDTNRARGKLVLEKWDYESSDVSQVMRTEMKEPVMETGRDKGRLVLGKWEDKLSDMTVSCY